MPESPAHLPPLLSQQKNCHAHALWSISGSHQLWISSFTRLRLRVLNPLLSIFPHYHSSHNYPGKSLLLCSPFCIWFTGHSHASCKCLCVFLLTFFLTCLLPADSCLTLYSGQSISWFSDITETVLVKDANKVPGVDTRAIPNSS